MAFRRPLYYVSGNLREMTDTMIQAIRDQMFWKYISNPSVTLGVVGSGGNLGTIYDTRLQAGAWAQSATRFYTEAETAEPSVVNVGLSRFNQSVASLSAPVDTNSRRFPVYYTTTGDIRPMTLQDMYDTFGSYAINALTTGGQTYTVSGGSVTGYTLVSGTQVFIDTRANTSAYTYNGIPETQDQPFDVAYWYLYKRNGTTVSYTPPAAVTSTTNNIQTYSTASFDSILEEIVRWMATSVSGYQIRYNLNGGGNNCGSGMTDSRLNGSGNYQTYYVNTDDYRSQEFPDGTAVVVATHYLRETKT